MNGQHEMANIKPPLLLLLASRTEKKSLDAHNPRCGDESTDPSHRFFFKLKINFFFCIPTLESGI